MKLSGIIETLESCTTTATLPEQQCQIARSSKHGRLIALLRKLPESTRQRLHGWLFYDTFPFQDAASIAPFSGGIESVGWHIGLQDGKELLCKIDRCDIASLSSLRNPTNFKEKINEHTYISGLYGSLAQETSLLIVRQPYRFGDAAIARIQPFIPGAQDIFEADPGLLDPADSTEFIEATHQAIANGRIPDILGYGNVVSDTDGHIRIVDTTITRTACPETSEEWDESLQKFGEFTAKMAALATTTI